MIEIAFARGRSDLDAGEAEDGDRAFHFRAGRVDVLQRDGAEPGKAIGSRAYELGNRIVVQASEGQPFGRRRIVRIGDRDRRDDLHRDLARIHVGDSARCLPAAFVDQAVVLTTAIQVAARFRFDHQTRARLRGEVLGGARDEVGVEVDLAVDHA